RNQAKVIIYGFIVAALFLKRQNPRNQGWLVFRSPKIPRASNQRRDSNETRSRKQMRTAFGYARHRPYCHLRGSCQANRFAENHGSRGRRQAPGLDWLSAGARRCQEPDNNRDSDWKFSQWGRAVTGERRYGFGG